MFTVKKIKNFIHFFWVVERPCMEGWREEREGEIIAINTHISRITLNINIFDSPMKRYILTEWMRKQDPSFCCIQKIYLNIKDRHYFRAKGWQKIAQANGPKRQDGGAILISNKIDLKQKLIKRDKEGHYAFIFIKGKIHQMTLHFLTSIPQTQG